MLLRILTYLGGNQYFSCHESDFRYNRYSTRNTNWSWIIAISFPSIQTKACNMDFIWEPFPWLPFTSDHGTACLLSAVRFSVLSFSVTAVKTTCVVLLACLKIGSQIVWVWSSQYRLKNVWTWVSSGNSVEYLNIFRDCKLKFVFTFELRICKNKLELTGTHCYGTEEVLPHSKN